MHTHAAHPRIGTIIIPTDPYWVQVMESIHVMARQLGDELVILEPAASNFDLCAVPPEDLVDQILAHNLDVLICTEVSALVLEALINEGLPVLCLSEVSVEHPSYCGVASLYEGGYIAGDYIGKMLAGKGHAVCVSAGLEQIVIKGQARLQGFLDALSAYAGISAAHIPAYWGHADTYRAMFASLQSYPNRIDAIFGVSDTVILAVRDAGRDLGVIDDQTILVGLNGDPLALAAIEAGSLSATVDIASENLGAMVVKMAHNAAFGEALPREIPQKFQLITRENVASIATRKLTAVASIPSRMVGYNRQQEQDRLTQLEISMEINRQIGSLLEREQLVEAIAPLVQKRYGYEWMRVLRWSEKNQLLELYEGHLSPAAQKVSIEQDWLLHQVFLTNEAIVIPDLETSHRWRRSKEWQGVRARAVLPIQLGNRVIGVLDLHASQPRREASLETIGLKLLANQLAIAIRNADLYLQALEARQVAERANQLKTRLLANVGHEMRTPLNAILGFSQAISQSIAAGSPIAPEQLAQDVHYIYSSGEHLMYIINDLLDLSRAEIGALNLYFEAVQPLPFLKNLFESFTPTIKVAAGVQWKLEAPEQLPIIRADAVRLRQILVNLMVNAGRFTTQGTITLGAQVELPYLHFWVQDTGEGMPLDIQEKIFEPFNTTGNRRRAEGIGLGLNITRHLVGLHNGLITLESQPGAGSTFHVYLPLPGMARETAPHPNRGCPALMLVISSATEIPEEIANICQRQHLQPCLIQNNEAMTQAFLQGAPAAIAWDLAHTSFPEWGLIYRLSSNPDCAILPVILYGAPVDDKTTQVGLTNVIFKPCSSNTLKEWISQVEFNWNEETTVLVVDDDPQARAYYHNLLAGRFPERSILLAENGAQALKILENEIPALILLDLLMPEVDGFTVLERVRGDLRTQHIPVVIISGKLLNYDDIQRLNYFKTIFYTKDLFSPEETIDFISQLEGDGPPLPQPVSLLVKQSLAYLHQHYGEPISRKEIADAVGVSENHLSKIFRQEISISPWDYLTRLRIHKAKELLLHTADTVTHIASQVGYSDSAYFSRVFNRLMGQSPVEFRQSRQ